MWIVNFDPCRVPSCTDQPHGGRHRTLFCHAGVVPTPSPGPQQRGWELCGWTQYWWRHDLRTGKHYLSFIRTLGIVFLLLTPVLVFSTFLLSFYLPSFFCFLLSSPLSHSILYSLLFIPSTSFRTPTLPPPPLPSFFHPPPYHHYLCHAVRAEISR